MNGETDEQLREQFMEETGMTPVPRSYPVEFVLASGRRGHVVTARAIEFYDGSGKQPPGKPKKWIVSAGDQRVFMERDTGIFLYSRDEKERSENSFNSFIQAAAVFNHFYRKKNTHK